VCDWLSEERVSVLRLWVAGVVFIVLAWLAAVPLMFFQGFFQFLMDEYGNVAVYFVYVLLYIVVFPLIFGVIIRWVSRRIF
jgi:hypothetical protein